MFTCLSPLQEEKMCWTVGRQTEAGQKLSICFYLQNEIINHLCCALIQYYSKYIFICEWEVIALRQCSYKEQKALRSFRRYERFWHLSPGSTTFQLWQKPLWWWSVHQSLTQENQNRSDRRKNWIHRFSEDQLRNHPTHQEQWRQVWKSENGPSWSCCEVRNKTGLKHNCSYNIETYFYIT